MKKIFLTFFIFLWITSIANADLSLSTNKIDENTVSVQVLSDSVDKVDNVTFHLWFDISSLNVENLSNWNLFSKTDLLEWNDSVWVIYSWNTNNNDTGLWTVATFNLVRKDWVTSNDFIVAIDEAEINSVSSSNLPSNTISFWSVTPTLEMSTYSDEVSIPSTSNIVAQWETNISTGIKEVSLLLLVIILFSLGGYLVFMKEEK